MANFLDLLSYAMRSLSHRKLRSYLTVLGIVIGVASVVALISISDGLYANVQDQLGSFGARNAVIVAGGTQGFSGGGYSSPKNGKLFENDYNKVKSMSGVIDISKSLSTRALLEFKTENISVSVSGIEPSAYEKLYTVNISSGRFLSDNDRGVAIVGSSYADKSIFKKNTMSVGSVFYLGEGKKKFKVIGLLDPSSSYSKNSVVIPFDDAKELAGDTIADKELSSITFKVAEGFDVDEVVSNVESNLAAYHRKKVDDKDFTIVTSKYILEQVGQIIGILTAFLGFITGVSLVVGGVGVANTMYMTVLEKTKEIGTLKAIGATSSTIMQLVILESAIIGLVGGVIGVGVGWLISLIVTYLGFKTLVTPYIVLFVLIFSIVVGILSGFFPAKKAAKLSPVEAMNYG
ncbi:MAG: ABC transporter permease [Candidatus Micrarchaeia archaeon]